MSSYLIIPVILIELSTYLIIIICGFKMVRYVNLNTNIDGNLKRLNKLLTKVLIILVSKNYNNFCEPGCFKLQNLLIFLIFLLTLFFKNYLV